MNSIDIPYYYYFLISETRRFRDASLANVSVTSSILLFFLHYFSKAQYLNCS